MTDIVERLRSDGEDERQRFRESRCTLAPLLNEAAAEIERLRAALEMAANGLEDWGAYTKAKNARVALEEPK
jgi:hypothetical protein